MSAVSTETHPVTYSLLPWERRGDFERLRNELMACYMPVGALEDYYIDEIAGCIWRKRRVQKAELAHITQRAVTQLHKANKPYVENGTRQLLEAALPTTDRRELPDEIELSQVLNPALDNSVDIDQAQKHLNGLQLLREKILHECSGYTQAIKLLPADIRKEWGLLVRDGEYERNPYHMAKFLSEYHIHDAKQALVQAHSSEIREHITSLSVTTNERMANILMKYESHLDNKITAAIDALMKLQKARLEG